MEGTIKLDATRFNAALQRTAQYSKRDAPTLLREQARGFIRRVVDLTPPGNGKADAAARKRGEAAVSVDLRRIFKPKDRGWLEYIEQVVGGTKFAGQTLRKKDGTPYLIDYDVILWGRDSMVGWHEARRRQDGRVRTAERDQLNGRKKSDTADIAYVPKENFAWFERRVKARVGVLASGWNDAAEALGAKLPQWVKRHGTGRGDVHIILGEDRMSVIMTNDVKFAGAVKGYQPRIQKALDEQAAAMERRVAFFLQKQAKRAGF